jgi:hypothetical protein
MKDKTLGRGGRIRNSNGGVYMITVYNIHVICMYAKYHRKSNPLY